MVADFRSDTVTRPTSAMRRAMAEAEVGDDVFGDDPTVLQLEERVADLFGKEAALFCPSGTMANQIAIGLRVNPGDEILMEELAHTFHFEVGGAARLWGAQARVYPSRRGTPDPAAVAALVRPDNVHLSRTTLCLVENTNNFHGGRVVPLEAITALRARTAGGPCGSTSTARACGTRTSPAGTPLRRSSPHRCRHRSMVAASRRGSAAPSGSDRSSAIPRGDRGGPSPAQAARRRHAPGGRARGALRWSRSTRVSTIIAEDHAARQAARRGRSGSIPETVDTNIVIADRRGRAGGRARGSAEQGVRVVAIGPDSIRLVTHRDVGDAEIEQALRAAAALL